MGSLGLIVSGNFATVVAPLDRLPPKARRAMAEGLKDGGDKVRTKVRKALKEQTNVKAPGSITRRTSSYAPLAGLTYEIRSSKKNMPIKEVPFRYSRSKKTWVRWDPREHWRLQKKTGYAGMFGPLPDIGDDGLVSAVPWNVARTFKRSFAHPKRGLVVAIDEGSGANGRRRWSFKPILGPAVHKELTKDRSLAMFQASIGTDVLPAVERKLARVMAGAF